MLKRLHLKNFTVFADADFEFSPGLNVLVGTNGTGKSHVLKVGYAVEAARHDKSVNMKLTSDQPVSLGAISISWAKTQGSSLLGVFLVEQLDSLIRWGAEDEAEIDAVFGAGGSVAFEITPVSLEAYVGSSSTKASALEASEFKITHPVYIPAKEILTLSWMLPGSQQIIAPIEENYLDLLNQLRLLPLRKLEVAQAIQALTDILGGEVQEQGDKYFLVNKAGRRTAISMVAEGLRKFGTLQKLLSNGSLTKNATLFWDEPESNLNPALLRQLAAILAELARQGFQIILATHSMSLLKEFHILSREKEKGDLPIRYFGLNARPGHATTVVAQNDFEYLPDVVALDVELQQADKLEEIFAREDREAHANNN